MSKDISFADFIIKQKFTSKKNDVYLVQDKADNNFRYILKKYNNPDSFKREKAILEFLNRNEIKAPQIINFANQYILMEYIEGQNILEIFEEWESINKARAEESVLLQQFCQSLKALYQVLQRINGSQQILKDTNLRNFLWAKSTMYFLDFEEVCEGFIEEDIGRICAYLLTYNPPFTNWKRQMVKKLIALFTTGLGLEEGRLLKEFDNQLGAIGIRRNILIPEDMKI